jgi:hypothetical protein
MYKYIGTGHAKLMKIADVAPLPLNLITDKGFLK